MTVSLTNSKKTAIQGVRKKSTPFNWILGRNHTFFFSDTL